MAEYVQLNLESMVPELETMKIIQLFSQDEVRRIIKKRKEFEYKMRRGTKFKEDLLNYIRYEWDLLVVIKNKTLSQRSFAPKRNNVAHSVSKHIQTLFMEALRRFAGDVKVWLSYLDFCTQLRLYPAMSQCLEKMLETHQDKPTLFCTAAQIEYNVLGSMDRARKFLLNGLRLHKESELLYREAFAMELSDVKKLRKEYADRDEEVPEDDPLLKGRLAELIYESSAISLRSIRLTADLLALSKKHPFAKELSARIYDDIKDKFEDQELRWDIVARHQLKTPGADNSAKDAVNGCVAVYEEAVKRLNTPEMWSFYVEAMIELNEDLTYLQNFKTNCLMQALLAAHCAEKLREDYYLKWADRLKGDNDQEKKRDVLKSGVDSYPGSTKLWEQYLMALAKLETPWGTIMKVFSSAVAALKSRKVDPLPLWKWIINYAQLTDAARAEELMKKGVLEGGNVSVAVKATYLEWLVLTRGLKAGRRAYADYAKLPPFSLAFHTKMIEFETYSVTVDVAKIRRCYDLMIAQFGHDSAEVWMDYVKFEQETGEPSRVPDLNARASRTLRPHDAETFIALFALYQIELGSQRATSTAAEPPAKIPKLAPEPAPQEA